MNKPLIEMTMDELADLYSEAQSVYNAVDSNSECKFERDWYRQAEHRIHAVEAEWKRREVSGQDGVKP